MTPFLYYSGKIFFTLLLISAGFYGNVSSVDFGRATYTTGAIGVLLILVVILSLTEILAIYCLVWRLIGQEIVSVNKDLFVVTRKIWGWASYKAYKTDDISVLRISHPADRRINTLSRFRRLLGLSGTIAFDYGAKTFRFGSGLDEAEGRQIIKKIQAHLPGFLLQFDADEKVTGE